MLKHFNSSLPVFKSYHLRRSQVRKAKKTYEDPNVVQPSQSFFSIISYKNLKNINIKAIISSIDLRKSFEWLLDALHKLQTSPTVTALGPLWLALLLCMLGYMFFSNPGPEITCDAIVTFLPPLFGTLQQVTGRPYNFLFASEKHWRMYWTAFVWLALLQNTIFLIPKVYFSRTFFMYKIVLLTLLSIPQTQMMIHLRRFLNESREMNSCYATVVESYAGVKEMKERLLLHDMAFAIFHVFKFSLKQFDVELENITLAAQGNIESDDFEEDDKMQNMSFVEGFVHMREKDARTSSRLLRQVAKSLRDSVPPESLDFRLIEPNESNSKWKDRIDLQNYIVAEIINTEITFNRTLQNIQSTVAMPILSNAVEFTPDEHDSMEVLKAFFAIWGRLTNEHLRMLKHFKTKVLKGNIIVNNEQVTKDDIAIDGVLQMVRSLEVSVDSIFPQLYKSLTGNYRLAMALINLYKGRHSSFNGLLKNAVNGGSIGFEGQLIQPIQRITRYPLLLKELSKCVSNGKTKLKIISMLKDLEAINVEANGEAFRAENLLIMADVDDRLRFEAPSKNHFSVNIFKGLSSLSLASFKNKITGSRNDDASSVVNVNEAISLVDPDHRFIYTSKYHPFRDCPLAAGGYVFFETKSMKSASLKTIYKRGLNVILFNDLMLLVQVGQEKKVKVYKVKYLVPLIGCKMGSSHADIPRAFKSLKSSVRKKKNFSFNGNDNVVMDLVETVIISNPLTAGNNLITLEANNILAGWEVGRTTILTKITLMFNESKRQKHWKGNFTDALSYANTHPTSARPLFVHNLFKPSTVLLALSHEDLNRLFGASNIRVEVDSLNKHASVSSAMTSDTLLDSHLSSDDIEFLELPLPNTDDDDNEKIGLIRERAATVLQSRFRGLNARKDFDLRRKAMYRAAKVIQKLAKKRRTSVLELEK